MLVANIVALLLIHFHADPHRVQVGGGAAAVKGVQRVEGWGRAAVEGRAGVK